MAQGHMIPFTSLAKRITESNPSMKITIVNTPLNIQSLKTTLSSFPNISLSALPFDAARHGLPPNSENTDTLTPVHTVRLFHASQSLQPHFHALIAKLIATVRKTPICIISDVFFGWAVEIAECFGIAHVGFSTGGAYGTAVYFSIWMNLPHRRTDAEEFGIDGFPEEIKICRSHLHPNLLAADGSDDWSVFFQKQISLTLKSDGLICNSIEEVEPLGLQLLRQNTGVPVWPVGPLLPLQWLESLFSGSGLRGDGKKSGIEIEKCMEWLDSKAEDSVLYISFGSQNTISAPQMMELAKGVEFTKTPFVWVIRPPMGFDLGEKFRPEWVPEGFGENKNGLLIHGWGPQLEILQHRSVGGFLSHCGWNSVLESLSQGVPIIGWPLRAEQSYNAKMLVEEMGVCVEMARGAGSRIDAGEVEKVIKVVMGREGKGQEMRRRAGEIGEKIRRSVRDDGEDGQRGSSVVALEAFLGFLMSKRELH
ncbi:hypothetical protein Sjap_005976 [Stephania japonica]|uniref:Glycosyltransferase n=1 Tax=Stephania japonica TaxID=461633 RepID=A0AAP0K6K5_9MAGN